MSDAQDAARYRWLRQARKSEHWRATIYGWIHVAQGFSTHGFTLSGDKLDVIVDAAMREDAAKSERAAENNGSAAEQYRNVDSEPCAQSADYARDAATPLANAAADTRTRGRRRNDATDQSV